MRCLPHNNNNNTPSWTWQLHPALAHNLQHTNETATPMLLPSPTTLGQSVSSIVSANVHANGPLTTKTAESLTRRKFQRTATNPDGDGGFRKPSIPASVTRRPLTDRRPSDGARKRNTSLREGMRQPSGPRDFPGSPGKRYAQTSSRSRGAIVCREHGKEIDELLTTAAGMATWTQALLPSELYPPAPTLHSRPRTSRIRRPTSAPDLPLPLLRVTLQTSTLSLP